MSPRNATEIGQRRSYKYKGVGYPSVTTLLKGFPQEWAIAYGAKSVAERAMGSEFYTRRQILAQQFAEDADEQADALTRWLKKAPFEKRDAAADAGTIRHGYLEDRLNGYAVPDGPLSDAERAVEQFLDTYRPNPIEVECQVVNTTHGYAGSADAFVVIYGKRYCLDLKTSKTATTDHKSRLQLAAYRYAERVFVDETDLGPVPPTDGALVLAISRDDPMHWSLIEVDAGEDTFARFLEFAAAWRWYDQHKETAVGELLIPQLSGAA